MATEKPKTKKTTSTKAKKAAETKKVKKAETAVKKSKPKKPVVAPKATKLSCLEALKAGTFFSWTEWQTLLGEAAGAWKSIVLPYSGVLCLALALQFLVYQFFVYGAVALLGGASSVENMVANLQVGTMPEISSVLIVLAAILGWLISAILIIAMSKVAFLNVLRNFTQKKSSSVLRLFFKDGWQWSGRYLWLFMRLFVYTMWPVFALLFGLSIFNIVVYNIDPKMMGAFNGVEEMVSYAAMAAVIYLAVKVMFAGAVLIHTQSSVGQAWKKAKALTHKNWSYAALMWGLLVALLYGINVIMGWAADYDPFILVDSVNLEEQLRSLDLLAFLVGLFIFAPIAAAFHYLLMLKVAKKQSVKL